MRLLLILFGTFLGLLCGEIFIRILNRQVLVSSNFIVQRAEELSNQNLLAYDPHLGWIPRPDTRIERAPGQNKITTNSQGIRVNEPLLNAQKEPHVLAVGDAFTFGDEVDDAETWPSYLEGKLGQGVVNGGVFGYGIDQTYLRMQSLIPIYKPRIVIFSLIENDIARAVLSIRDMPKPYFELAGDSLILKNTPVPKSKPLLERLGYEERVLGHSLLYATLYLHRFPRFSSYRSLQKTEQNQSAIACQIFHSLIEVASKDKTRIIVLLQDQIYDRPPLECIDRKFVEVIDMGPIVTQWKSRHDHSFFVRGELEGHHSAKGNEFVAQTISEHIRGAMGAGPDPL